MTPRVLSRVGFAKPLSRFKSFNHRSTCSGSIPSAILFPIAAAVGCESLVRRIVLSCVPWHGSIPCGRPVHVLRSGGLDPRVLSLDEDQADYVGYGVSRLLSTHSFCQESPLSGQLEPCFRRACHQDVGWFENTTPTFRPDYGFLFQPTSLPSLSHFLSFGLHCPQFSKCRRDHATRLTTYGHVQHFLSKCEIRFDPPIYTCGLRQQRRSVAKGRTEREKNRCRCKMPRLVKSNLHEISQSNDVLADV